LIGTLAASRSDAPEYFTGSEPALQPLLPDIDWSAPWLAHLRALGLRLPAHGSVAARLNALRGPDAPQFVAQSELPPGRAYESHIAATDRVPTRDNLHDLFNGLVWLRHGLLKRRMNRLQAAAIAAQGIAATRGALRDALTLADENGARWLDPDPVLLHALRQRDWQALFVTHRARWAGQAFEIVGHALLEQLCTQARKGLTAHVMVGDPATLGEGEWAAKPFLPLPVLGIPGWWPQQDRPDFYDDPQVFRKPRVLKTDARP
jgi:hypothetical protein